MGDVVWFPGHRRAHCRPDCSGCALCRGGLFLCGVCGGLEGSLPTDCPGERMDPVLSDGVYAGEVDYRRREGWVEKMSRTWEELYDQTY